MKNTPNAFSHEHLIHHEHFILVKYLGTQYAKS
jgi:hypothetical protein